MSSRKSSRRKSLSEKIADFSDPTPRDIDPESLTSWNDNTSANRDDEDDDDDIQEDYHEDDEDDDYTTMSNDGRLRLQAEPDALNDPRYAGVKVSRRELRPDGVESSSDDGSNSSGGSDSDSDSNSNSNNSSSDYSSSDNSDSDHHDNEAFTRFDDAAGDESEEDALDRRLSTFSTTSMASPSNQTPAEIQEKTATRAQHTLNQKKLWTELLGVRVHLQPLLELGNRLPSSSEHMLFHDHSDENLDAFGSVVSSLTSLLKTCVSVSETLSRQHPDVKALPQTKKRKRQTDAVEDLWDEMDTNYVNFTPYRDAVVSRWNKKTQLQSGAALNKKFKVVNQGILKQIGSILSDETRLLKRTRTRRVEQKAVGVEIRRHGGGSGGGSGGSGGGDDDDDDELDDEIFDDNDFFKGHRQEYLESTMSGDDFMSLTKSYASRRVKKKKKVDTKASKGRRLKFVVMPKLQNFCAPEFVRTPSIDLDVLVASLFGGK